MRTLVGRMDFCIFEKSGVGKRRLEDAESNKVSGVLEVIADSIGILILLLGLIVVLAVVWGYLLKSHSRKTIWGTIGLEVAGLIGLAVWLKVEGESVAYSIGVCILLYIAFVAWQRKRIDLSARLMGEACQALKTHTGVFGAFDVVYQ